MNRWAAGCVVLALSVTAACGGSDSDRADSPSGQSVATAAPPIDWPVACERVSAAAREHLNGADEFTAYAEAISAILDGVDQTDAGPLERAESAGRQSAEVQADPEAQANDRVDASQAILDSLSTLGEKCKAEGSNALS